jgi:hypothetical protein
MIIRKMLWKKELGQIELALSFLDIAKILKGDFSLRIYIFIDTKKSK